MKKLTSNGIRICLSIAAIIVTTLSCQKNASSPVPAGSTALSIHLTDDPSFVFDAVFIDIAKLEVKIEDNNGEQENEGEHHSGGDDNGNHGGNNSDTAHGGSWIAINIRPGVYNILNFRNGIDTLLGTTSFPAIKQISKVRITLGTNNSVVLNGKNFPLLVNNNSITVNLDETSVNVAGGDLHVFLDFDAGRSIKFDGTSFQLNSSIKAFSEDKAGTIEGRIVPAAAKAIIYAINGTDTSTAMPEHEGEFKLIGLKPGTYTLVVKATANNYQGTTIPGVMITKKEDTKVGTITLHQ